MFSRHGNLDILNHIFHYYITGFLAMRAGFSLADAQVIATAAQYVDHALIPYRIQAEDHTGGKKPEYLAIATHHFGFWDKAQEDSVWIPFHFFPGGEMDDSPRRDGQCDPQAVRPNSPPVKELLITALKTNNLFRIGIALHTYADSWAHQNFIGRNLQFNRLQPNSILPPIGHAHAESSPDILHARWLDPRLVDQRVDNRTRFLAAAKMIYKYLATNQRHAFADANQVISELENILGPTKNDGDSIALGKGIQANIRKGLDAILSTKSFPLLSGKPDSELELDFQIATGLPPYDRTVWRKAAFINENSLFSVGDNDSGASMNDKAAWLRHEILRTTGFSSVQARALPGFFESALYQWSEAAQEHLNAAKSIIKQI